MLTNKRTDKPGQSHLLLFGGGNNSHEGVDSHQYLSRLHSVWISPTQNTFTVGTVVV